MKKISALFAVAVVACIGVTMQSGDAQAQAQLKPGVIATSPAAQTLTRFVAPVVKGTIKVPAAAATGNLAAVSCADIIVVATSQDTNPPPAGGLFTSPKWTTHTAATGNWASGTCSYSLRVHANSNFAVSAGGGSVGNGNTGCYLVMIDLAPAQAGWFKLPLGGTKVQDFSATSVACDASPPA
jgi:hypothetical protein